MKPEMIIDGYDGDKVWHLLDKLHREDGPAVEYKDGDLFWFINGEPHRIIINNVQQPYGYKEYWLNGTILNEQEWLSKVLFNVVKIELFS